MTNVSPFHRRMTPEEYERERATLRQTYGDTSAEASAKRDQALAALFYRSGWTQEELATKEGKSQSWVQYRLRFGRFLEFTTRVVNPDFLPNNLTEGKFRKYWDQTEGSNERQRFAEVQRLMAEHLKLVKEKGPQITQAIAEHFGDGKWRPLEKVAEHFEIMLEQADDALRRSTKFKMEKKKVGKAVHFRLFPKTRMIGSEELTTKLDPIIEQLRAEGKKHPAAASPGTVARLAHELGQLLEEWTK